VANLTFGPLDAVARIVPVAFSALLQPLQASELVDEVVDRGLGAEERAAPLSFRRTCRGGSQALSVTRM
jgi:hypothetical protein